MNENLDLTKILEGCPVGTEFYSTIYGKCYFAGIVNDKTYPIKLDFYNEEGEYHNDRVTIDGRHRVEYDGECTLFPSKDQRDWSKFVRFRDKPKIERFDPHTLKAFDKILVREHPCAHWRPDFYSIMINKTVRTIGCCDSRMCIPYNEETEHLAGTNQDCPKFYKWWEK